MPNAHRKAKKRRAKRESAKAREEAQKLAELNDFHKFLNDSIERNRPVLEALRDL